jgi:hypothetical protein
VVTPARQTTSLGSESKPRPQRRNGIERCMQGWPNPAVGRAAARFRSCEWSLAAIPELPGNGSPSAASTLQTHPMRATPSHAKRRPYRRAPESSSGGTAGWARRAQLGSLCEHREKEPRDGGRLDRTPSGTTARACHETAMIDDRILGLDSREKRSHSVDAAFSGG